MLVCASWSFSGVYTGMQSTLSHNCLLFLKAISSTPKTLLHSVDNFNRETSAQFETQALDVCKAYKLHFISQNYHKVK